MSESLIQSLGTGSALITGNQQPVLPVSVGYYPEEGSRVISSAYDWNETSTAYQEDLSQVVARGMETTIQSAWVDNSANPFPVTIVINGTQQQLVVNAYSQAFLPTLFTGSPGFSISCSPASTSITRLCLLNVPCQTASVWLVSPILPTDGGQKSVLNVTSSEVVKLGAGRAGTLAINSTIAVANGFLLICDAATVAAAGFANAIWSCTTGGTNSTEGTVIPLNFPFQNGLVILFVAGATGAVSLSYT